MKLQSHMNARVQTSTAYYNFNYGLKIGNCGQNLTKNIGTKLGILMLAIYNDKLGSEDITIRR